MASHLLQTYQPYGRFGIIQTRKFMDFSLSFSDILANMWNEMDEDDEDFD